MNQDIEKRFTELERRINSHRHLSSDKTQRLESNVYVLYRILGDTTNAAVANVVGGDYVMPFTGSIIEIGATVDTAGTTNTLTIDVNKNGSTIMTTKITVDSGEKTSRTAATAENIAVSGFQKGDIFTFDVDAIHTTPSKGITIFMKLREQV